MTPGSDDDEQWRFSLAEVGDDEQPDGPGADDGGGNIAGSLDRDQPLEPGEIDLENALFVALGAALVVGLFVAVMLGI